MAFSARRNLATSLSHQLSRRLHPSTSYCPTTTTLKTSSSVPPSPQTQSAPFSSALTGPSRSRTLSLPLPFALHLAAHRNFSTSSPISTPDIDAAEEVLSDAASSVFAPELLSEEVAAAASSIHVLPAPYAGEVAATAAESFPPVAALQYLLDAVQSFTGLNWWASIALTTVMIRLLIVPLLVSQMKARVKLNSTHPRSMEVGTQKLGELFLRVAGQKFNRLYLMKALHED